MDDENDIENNQEEINEEQNINGEDPKENDEDNIINNDEEEQKLINEISIEDIKNADKKGIVDNLNSFYKHKDAF